MLVTVCHSALDAESRVSLFWIPAGAYPVLDAGRNDIFIPRSRASRNSL